ncbi:ADP-ribose pyrophosphatase [Bacillus paralicheniformis]|nr:ADP-ribose pyrophosphatase [Bacillus paralicheniformis]TWJ63102.1 ADP-ribose pyrophosphatase [Bacillus paralicheniformis]TWJ79226.1 ADP-ribose pyrophosphatase [Bacillus paralicheniformis]TWJ79492.1 ADP-ribose pyrophosphatase [Bacillus paralicheniformis]TWK24821.1 putative mutator protein MutT4 [Bacillus paralicheniformis]
MVPHRRKQIKNFTKHHNKLVKETLKTPYLIRFITKFKK